MSVWLNTARSFPTAPGNDSLFQRIQSLAHLNERRSIDYINLPNDIREQFLELWEHRGDNFHGGHIQLGHAHPLEVEDDRGAQRSAQLLLHCPWTNCTLTLQNNTWWSAGLPPTRWSSSCRGRSSSYREEGRPHRVCPHIGGRRRCSLYRFRSGNL